MLQLGVYFVPRSAVDGVEAVVKRWANFMGREEATMLQAALTNTIKATPGSGAGAARRFRGDLRVLAELIISLTKRRR